MEKHTNIPAAATWNVADNQWELGEKNSAGKEIGVWNNWHAEGHLCRTVDYGDGNPPFPAKSFHPDGTLAQEGNWYGGQKWLGTYRWIKSENTTSEPFPAGPAEKNPIVWIAEFDYIGEGIYNAQRYYDKQKQEVSIGGEPLPIRPATVPERAHYVNKRWVMGQVDTRKGKYTGDHAEWDLDGAIILKRVYSQEMGEVLEEHQYEDRMLWTSNVYNGSEWLQSFYHRDLEPPVISSSILYLNNSKDRTGTFFDKTGSPRYTVRVEEVSSHHVRRYFNGVLVYEGIGNPDHAKAPFSIKYYYAGGATRIDYTSNGDGTGLWRLYNEAGQELLTLPENDEEKANKDNHWEIFIPSWRYYEYEKNGVDWDTITENFKAVHTYHITKSKVYALVAPEHLKQELEKIDWENIETAMEGGEKLPVAITGLLTEDEDVADICLESIWYEIENQGSIYEATYKVAGILTRMFPYYTNVPVVQSRLITFLFNVLVLSYPVQNKELYDEMIAALDAMAPYILPLAGDEEELIAVRAQYILLHGCRNRPETEALFIRERQRTTNNLLRRAYATFSLGSLYLFTKQEEKGIAHFSAAFPTETDKLVRLMMAVYLVLAAKKEAQDSWIAELKAALTDPDQVSDEFYRLQPFIGGYDVQEYVLMTLGHAKQEVCASQFCKS